MSVAALFTIARTWKQPRCPSIYEWMKKLWYIYTMEYQSDIKRNAFESFLMLWMYLERVIQSGQKEKKSKCCVLRYIYGMQKNGTDEPICRVAIEADIGKRLVDTVEEGESGTNGGNSMETYTLPYVNRQPVGICKLGCSVTTWRDGMGWEVEGGSRGRGHPYPYGWFHVDVWQRPTQHGKAIIQ